MFQSLVLEYQKGFLDSTEIYLSEFFKVEQKTEKDDQNIRGVSD